MSFLLPGLWNLEKSPLANFTYLGSQSCDIDKHSLQAAHVLDEKLQI